MVSVYFNFSLPISMQMALDEALFEDLEKKGKDIFLRFYTASQPAYTVGYFQKKSQDASLAFLTGENMPVVRRMTGGGLVSHREDLIFSLGARTEKFPFLKTTAESYVWIHSMIQKALARENVSTELVSCKAVKDMAASSEKGICFKSPVAGDVVWKGRKIAGGAQKRKRDFFLHQGSIALGEIAIAVVDPRLFSETFLETFEKESGIDFKIGELSPSLLNRAQELATSRYQPLQLSLSK